MAYKLCELGELTHVRISSAIRIAPADLEAFLWGDVHSVPENPSVIDRFGTYLVPRLPMGQLFTVKDLAARWAVCTATIYWLAKSGRIESLRIGNSIRFSATAVSDYEQARVGAKAERRLKSAAVH
jgi:excisionase family DNA binding protein